MARKWGERVRLTLTVFMGLALLFGALPAFSAGQMPADKALLTINGVEYSAADYLDWREHKQEEEGTFPQDPSEFINWQLLAREAESMELYTLPSFMHKVDVFVKVRSLMILKNEEVDSKIKITEEDIREVYDTQYVPQRHMVELHFNDQEVAKDIYAKLREGKPGYNDLYKYAGSGSEPLFMVRAPRWFRPLLVPEEHRKDLDGLSAGDFSKPLKGEKDFIVYQVLGVKGYELEDFESRKKDIRDTLRKKKQAILTENLLNNLKTKYNVEVDRQLLASLDISSPDPQDMNKILVRSDRSQVDVAYFMSQVKRQSSLMGGIQGDKEKQEKLKGQVLNSMISNSMVDWEAIDRHYEEKEPLKGVYQFYRQHRMIVELKERLYKEIAVSEEDLAGYYKENINEFSEPYKVKITYVQGGEEDIASLWSQSIAGLDIMKAAHGMNVKIVYGANQENIFDGLSVALKDKLAKLSKGEVSTPFLDDGAHSLVRLDDKIPSLVRPYEQVKSEVRKKVLKLKRAEILKGYLDQLSKQSSIKIDNSVWEEIAAQQK